MNILSKNHQLLGLALAALCLTACSDNDDSDNDLQPTDVTTVRTWTLTTQATLNDATTRALSEDGNTITATFKTTDEVLVYKEDENDSERYALLDGTLKPQTDGASATLTGTITGTLNDGDQLLLMYRKNDHPQIFDKSMHAYAGQKGTLEDIAENFDCAMAQVTVSGVATPNLSTTDATFSAQQSITKVKFSQPVKSFTVYGEGLILFQDTNIENSDSYSTGVVDVTLDTPSDVAYVALANTGSGKVTYTFTALTADGTVLTGTKSAALVNGKNYTASVSLSPATVDSYWYVGTEEPQSSWIPGSGNVAPAADESFMGWHIISDPNITQLTAATNKINKNVNWYVAIPKKFGFTKVYDIFYDPENAMAIKSVTMNGIEYDVIYTPEDVKSKRLGNIFTKP